MSALFAEFDRPEAIVRAARELYARGYRKMDASTPFPMRELEDALGLARSRLPWVSLVGGLTGATVAWLLQWWMNAVDYPLDVGGRPGNAPPAFVPIAFEMGVLGAALGALCALAIVTGLPALWHPDFEVPGIESASIDRFWLAIDTTDPAFEPGVTVRELERLGAVAVAEHAEEAR